MTAASRLLTFTVSVRLRAHWSGQRRRAAVQVEEELRQSCGAAGGVGLLTGKGVLLQIYKGFIQLSLVHLSSQILRYLYFAWVFSL